jgi:outer membrane protein assembly factor BamB
VQLIVEDAIILAYQVSPTINYIQITALDKTNGDILWEQDMYITSNRPAIIDNALFIMTEDTELVSIDLTTGQITTQAIFTPGVQEVSGRNTNVTIAVDDRQMLVYFASSYQLFDFHFLSDR